MSNVVPIHIAHCRSAVQVRDNLTVVAGQIAALSQSLADLQIDRSGDILALQAVMEAALALHRTSSVLANALTTSQALQGTDGMAEPEKSVR
jgi:hypothetical protein